ncbi:MAG: LLM class flavin-dependent oxidoreductase [Saprospiraceae bacterium]|nr:LLM class flavin-dependent oxidoreductase [Saprospiraceae bacterium]
MIVSKSVQTDASEVAWFAPICNGDFEFLGVPNNSLKSNWTHTSKIVLTADKIGFRNILCPSSYQVGQDMLTFASAVAPLTRHINLLTAIRCGEVHPPMLARAIATLDHILRGRLTLNIISSAQPGETMTSDARYRRSREVIQILRQAWTQDEIRFQGEFYSFELATKPVKPYQQNGGRLLYFGGYSSAGVDLCAEYCDVYLMWPETIERLREQMEKVNEKAQAYRRIIDFGLRIHVIDRETEDKARAAARKLVSKLDESVGTEIRERALDAKSYGVSLQAQLRDQSDLHFLS